MDFENKYKLLLSIASDGFIIYNKEGEILDFNEGAHNKLGYTKEEFEGKNLFDFFNPDDLKKRPLAFDSIAVGHNVIDRRRVRTKDGGYYFIELNSIKLTDGNFMVLAKDITEKARAEADLQLKNQAIESSISGIGMSDMEGNIFYANQTLHKMWGSTKENSLIGKNVTDVFVGITVKDIFSGIINEAIEYVEGVGKRLDGSLFPVVLTANKMVNRKGEAIGFFGSFIDISEQKKIRELSDRLMENLPGIFFVYDSKQEKIIKWNKKVAEITGYTEDELNEMPFPELLAENERFTVMHKIVNAQSNIRYESEVTISTKSGSLLPYYFTSFQIQQDNSTLLIVNGVDISAKKITEDKLRRKYKQLQFLADFTDSISRAKKLEEIYDISVQGVLKSMDAFKASLLLFNEEGKMEFKAYHQLSDDYRAMAVKHCPWDESAVKPMPVYVSDIKRDDTLQELLPIIQAEQIASMGFIPLVYAGKLRGKVMVYYKEPHHFSDSESQFLQTIAKEIAFAISERESDLALRKSEQQFKDLVNRTKDIIFSTDAEGRWTFLNPAWTEILGYTVEESLGKTFFDFTHKSDIPEAAQKFTDLINYTTNQCDHELRYISKQNEICWIEVKARRLEDNNGNLIGSSGIITNISERKNAEAAIAITTSQLRELSAHLQDVREEERVAIAREIHDELGQQLSVLKYDFGWIYSELGNAEPTIAKKINGIKQLLDNAINTIRRLSSDIRPSMLDDMGLIDTIDWYLEDFENRFAIKTEFVKSIDFLDVHDKAKTALFRIFQESLTNVIRYANATEVKILLIKTEDEILLEIEDNGNGFDVPSIMDKKTLGLLGMKERSLLMGGICTINSEPGKGTTVAVAVPISSLSII